MKNPVPFLFAHSYEKKGCRTDRFHSITFCKEKPFSGEMFMFKLVGLRIFRTSMEDW